MRKFLLPLAAAASALVVAAPASAQMWSVSVQSYGNLGPVYGAPSYGAPYGQGYGYGRYNYGQVRALQARIDQVQRQINHLARNRMITRSEHNNLTWESRVIERRLRNNARDGRGLDRREVYNTERQIFRLEQRVARDVRDGRQWRYRW